MGNKKKSPSIENKIRLLNGILEGWDKFEAIYEETEEMIEDLLDEKKNQEILLDLNVFFY